MQKTYCSSDQDEEEKYLCSHPSCIKQQGNKLICIDCFERHKKGRTKFHEKITINSVMQLAQQNMEGYIQIQECIMQRWESFSQKYEQNLSEQVNAIIRWQEEQMKLLKCQKEQQIYILEQNILQAKEHYKLEKLDNLIYFYKLDLQTENELSDEFSNETEKQLNHQFKEISIKGQALISKQFNFSDLFKTKKIDLQIQECPFQDVKFEKCEFHRAKKNYVCTHEILNEEKNFELDCLGCIEKRHEQVCQKKSCLKKITTIQKEQETLKRRMKQESLKMQQKVQGLLLKQIENFCIQQKQNQEFYDNLKEQLWQVEKETIFRLKQKPQSQIILGNIDKTLLMFQDDVIEVNLQQEFSDMKKKVEILEKQKPQQQKIFLDLDKECEYNKDYFLLMKQQNEILSQKANLYDNLVKQSMIEMYQQQMGLITDQISKVAQQGVQIEKLVSESQNSLSTNLINLQNHMEKSNTQVTQNVQNGTKDIQNSLRRLTTMESLSHLKQISQQQVIQQEISQIKDQISKVAQQGVQIEKLVSESKSSQTANIIKLQDQMEKSNAQVSLNVSTGTKEVQNSLKQLTAMESQQQSILEKINSSNTEINNNLKQFSQKQVNQQEISQIKDQISKVAEQGVQIDRLVSESKSTLSTNIIKLQDQMENNFKEQKSNTLVIQNIQNETKDMQSNFKKIVEMENKQYAVLDKLSSSNTEISTNQKELQKNQKEQLQLQSNLNQLMTQNQNTIKNFNDESKAKFENIEQKQNSQINQQKITLDQLNKLEKQIAQVQNEITILSKNQPNIESSKLINKIQENVLQILREFSQVEMDLRRQAKSLHISQQSSEAPLKIKTEEKELNYNPFLQKRASFILSPQSLAPKVENDNTKKANQQQLQGQK